MAQFEHNPTDHEDPAAEPTWTIGFVGSALLVVIVLGVTWLYYSVAAEQRDDVFIDETPNQIEGLRESQNALLDRRAGWIKRPGLEEDEEIDVFTIPIDRAMELMVQEYGPRGVSDAGSSGHTP